MRHVKGVERGSYRWERRHVPSFMWHVTTQRRFLGSPTEDLYNALYICMHHEGFYYTSPNSSSRRPYSHLIRVIKTKGWQSVLRRIYGEGRSPSNGVDKMTVGIFGFPTHPIHSCRAGKLGITNHIVYWEDCSLQGISYMQTNGQST